MEPAVRVPNNNNRVEIVEVGDGVKIAHAGELIHLPSRDDMTRILECQICSEIPVAPIYICANGHSICSYCNSRVSKCGLCNGKLTGIRNYSLEEIISASAFTCMYESEGCRDIIKGENVIKHSADCICQPPPEFQAAQQERQLQADVPHVVPPSSDSDSSDEEFDLARGAGLVENISDIFFGYLRRGGGPPRTSATMTLPLPSPLPQPNANAATTSQPMRQTARMSTGGQSACRIPRPVPTTATATTTGSTATASEPRDRRTLTARRSSTTRQAAMRGASLSTPRRGRPSQSTTTGVPPPTATEQPNANAATTSQPMRQTARMSTGGQIACRVPRPVPTTAGTTTAESNATASAPRDRRTLTARRRSNTRHRPVMHMRGTSLSAPRRGRPSQSTSTGVPSPADEQRTAGSTASTTRGSTPLAHRTRARTFYRSRSSSESSSSSSTSSSDL